jgi:uncharacterized protein YeaO (DUF488 family)
MIAVKRAYDPADPSDGARVLVDRIWPRGVSRDRAALDEWLPEVAPSTDLRRWYQHEPARFAEFSRRYRAELDDAAHADAVARLRSYATAGTLTMITAVRDVEYAHTRVLLEFLQSRPGR